MRRTISILDEKILLSDYPKNYKTFSFSAPPIPH